MMPACKGDLVMLQANKMVLADLLFTVATPVFVSLCVVWVYDASL